MWNFGTRHKHLNQELLSEYVDGRLSPAARRRVDGELARCSACQRELETLWFTTRLLQGLPAVAPRRSFVMAGAPVAMPGRAAPARPALLLRAPQWAYAAAASVALLAFTALASGDIVNSLTPRSALDPTPNASFSVESDGFNTFSAPAGAPLAESQGGNDNTSSINSGPSIGVYQAAPFPDATPEPPAPSEVQRESSMKAPAPTSELSAMDAAPAAPVETPASGAPPDATGRSAQNGDKLIPATPADAGSQAAPAGPEAGGAEPRASQLETDGVGAAPSPLESLARRGGDDYALTAGQGQSMGGDPDLSFTQGTAPRTPWIVRVLEGVTAALGLTFLVGWAARRRLGRRAGEN